MKHFIFTILSILNPVNVLSSRKKMEPAITVRKAVTDIKLSFTVANQQLKNNDSRFLLIRYEDICNNTRHGVEQIAAFLNIPVSPELFTPTVAGKLAQVNSSFADNHPAGEILNLKQHGVILSKTDQQYVGECLGKLAHQLGYGAPRLNFLYKYYLRLLYLFKS